MHSKLILFYFLSFCKCLQLLSLFLVVGWQYVSIVVHGEGPRFTFKPYYCFSSNWKQLGRWWPLSIFYTQHGQALLTLSPNGTILFELCASVWKNHYAGQLKVTRGHQPLPHVVLSMYAFIPCASAKSLDIFAYFLL